MMRLSFGFGDTVQTAEVPEKNLLGTLLPGETQHPVRGKEAVRAALADPVGTPPLGELFRSRRAEGGGKRIVIITSDISRPCPSQLILPEILEELFRAGARPEEITVVFALGSHRRQSEEERRKLVGERVFSLVRCTDSDPDDCVLLGVTAAGTPVDITRTVAEADFRICAGNIEFHYFAGFSGGVKALFPGCASRSAIQANHAMMLRPGACAGRLEGNPLRDDLEEAGRLAGIDFIVNVVLDEKKEIVHAAAGDAVLAHRAGCAYLERMYSVKIREKADIVLVSQGGAPKDLNLYQTQKALDNAKNAVRDGGVVILIGSCREGLGEAVFERWMKEAGTPRDLTERVRTKFELGGHKAAAIAMVLERADIYLVSEMDPELVRKCFLTPFRTVQEALDAAFLRCGPDASVLAMPYGGSTLPMYVPQAADADL